MFQQRSLKGFTLIELLVVIAIVGMLASVVMINVLSGKQQSRDVKRKSELEQVQLALRMFKDTYGRYPSDVDAPGKCTYTTSTLSDGCLNVLVTKGLLPSLPSGDLYYYDNWCRTGLVANGSSDKQYRMWVLGETNNNGLANYWWSDNYIGITTCTDPS